MQEPFSIRDLSKEFEVTTRTLRFYEEKGLLKPLREGQSRLYSASDRARLRLILRGKRLGFTLEESADIISMYDPKSNNRRQLEALIEKFAVSRERLEAQKRDIERMIEDLDRWEARSRRDLAETTFQGDTK